MQQDQQHEQQNDAPLDGVAKRIGEAMTAAGYTEFERRAASVMAKCRVAMSSLADPRTSPLVRMWRLTVIAEAFGELLSLAADELKIDEAGQDRLVAAAEMTERLVREGARDLAKVLYAGECAQTHTAEQQNQAAS